MWILDAFYSALAFTTLPPRAVSSRDLPNKRVPFMCGSFLDLGQSYVLFTVQLFVHQRTSATLAAVICTQRTKLTQHRPLYECLGTKVVPITLS